MRRIDWTIKFIMIVIGMWLAALAFATTAKADHGVRYMYQDYFAVEFPDRGAGCSFMDKDILVAKAFVDFVHGNIGAEDLNAIVKLTYPELNIEQIRGVTRSLSVLCGIKQS